MRSDILDTLKTHWNSIVNCQAYTYAFIKVQALTNTVSQVRVVL